MKGIGELFGDESRSEPPGSIERRPRSLHSESVRDRVRYCSVCDTPLDDAYCPRCDVDTRSYEFRAWREYVARYRKRMTAIATAAEEVWTREELELLGADLLQWPEDRTAYHLGVSVKELRARRDEIHERIRAAIGPERIAMLSCRRA
ncbi:MAG: hypothetical protein ACRDM0_13850 [Thermoleophilaceae bacterium]